jgi:Flavodoxins
MKTLVIYYSYTGNAKKIAEDLAKKESADILEVKEKNTRSKFNAYVFGSFAAMRQKQVQLQPFNSDFSKYDKLIIVMPIWAGHPAPAMSNIINLLPKNKKIALIMTSGSGNSKGSSEKTKALIKAKGCNVIKYEDRKASSH